MSSRTHSHAINNLPSVKPPKPELPASKKTVGRVKASIFIDDDMHEQVTDICKKHKFSQQKFIVKAISFYLEALGSDGIGKDEK